MWHLIKKFQKSGFEKFKQTLFCAPFPFLAVRFWSWHKLAFKLEGRDSPLLNIHPGLTVPPCKMHPGVTLTFENSFF